MIKIKVLDFTEVPGARYRTDGEGSGQEFREDYLEKYFENNRNEKIVIDLDGTEGYATSFLEEAFGGLARKFTSREVTERVSFISNEEPLLIKEIKRYIEEAD